MDFEGEPLRSLSERQLKRSPLRDVAGMLRSLHYAAFQQLKQDAGLRPEDIPFLEDWAQNWYRHVASVYLNSYLKEMEGSNLVPKDSEQIKILLEAFLLDKAFYEVNYEMLNRPEWISIPLRGIEEILESS